MTPKVFAIAAPLVASVLALYACGRPSGPSGVDASQDQQTADSGWDAGVGDAESDVDIIIPVDGSGDCGDFLDAPALEVRRCCNGVSCQGRCYLSDDGGSYCGCGHIKGGCEPGLICCAFMSSTCTLYANCQPH